MFGADYYGVQSEGFDANRVDSPRFAKTNRRFESVPAFGEEYPHFNPSLVTESQMEEERQGRIKMEKLKVLTKFQNRLTKLVLILEVKVRVWALSESFCSIFSAANRAPALRTNELLVQTVQSKLGCFLAFLQRKMRLMKQCSFHSILATLILAKNQAANTKKLQALDTRRYHQVLLKQNDDRDSANALEIQNTFLKKQLLKEDREQNTFIDSMNGLLDRYDIYHEANDTHRPYLTSFCSSPDALQGRRKFPSNADEKKLKTSKKY